MAEIFISYRRSDSAHAAARLQLELQRIFGEESVFLDVTSLRVGGHYPAILQRELDRCQILILVIGPNKLDAQRLHESDDLIRHELEVVLARDDVLIVPVLLDATTMPDTSALPRSIDVVTEFQAHRLIHDHFSDGVKTLAEKILRKELSAVRVATNPDEVLRYYIPGHGKKEWFQDHDISPEMVVIPSGRFDRGSSPQDEGAKPDEMPKLGVDILKPFAVSRFTVSNQLWRSAISFWGFSPRNYALPKKFDQKELNFPVVDISLEQAGDYVDFLTRLTGRKYRILTEAEWEFAARAGTEGLYSFGDISPQRANYGRLRESIMPVDSFEPNAWGLYNVHGNVAEWVQDRYASYDSVPNDGTAHEPAGDMRFGRVIRGGWYGSSAEDIRSASRDKICPTYSQFYVGLRVGCDV
ncbi:MAG: SUMF1/EgtB/PvdO family nonheme iron enzyme [Hyphomicrobiaceae bacterium]